MYAIAGAPAGVTVSTEAFGNLVGSGNIGQVPQTQSDASVPRRLLNASVETLADADMLLLALPVLLLPLLMAGGGAMVIVLLWLGADFASDPTPVFLSSLGRRLTSVVP
jgi:hypothetical protein